MGVFHGYKRPGVDYFLREVSSTFEVVLFTAARQSYAECVRKVLDPHSEMISDLRSRKHYDSFMYKNLSWLERNLARTVLIDDSCEVVRMLFVIFIFL
jgi:TFIIF-interacting CTD phosphatase-like protein